MKFSIKLAGLTAASLLTAVAVAQTAPPAPPAGPGPGYECPMGGPGQGVRGQGMRGQHRGHGAYDPARAQARIDALETSLQLQPAQKPAWDALESRMLALRDAHTKQFAEMQALRGDPQKMLEFRAETMKRNADALSDLAKSRAALVAVLTPEQKAKLDAARGAWAAGHGGHGPGGYGPGRGSGGPAPAAKG
jgi:Spy/CpxP family protein refolding chaperone